MEKLANSIVDIISDYHSDYEFKMSPDHVLTWVNQFEPEDRRFILSEFLHLLGNGIYISKLRAKKLLSQQIHGMTKIYKYVNAVAYLSETVFLRMQPSGKSQCILLELLNEVLIEEFGITLKECGQKQQKNFIYIDDILATGKTILGHCRTFFTQKDYCENGNLHAILNDNIRFAVLVFCAHSWAMNNIKISLKLQFNEDLIVSKLKIYKSYLVENNLNDFQPALNLAYPVLPQPDAVKFFLQKLPATKFEDRAFRKKTQPHIEKFFSNTENRNRFENIILNKGIEILTKVKTLSNNHRPLGNTNPNYKTLGTGTLFFTWRNVSNTCPIVFWWNNPAHEWAGLFPLHQRGVS